MGIFSGNSESIGTAEYTVKVNVKNIQEAINKINEYVKGLTKTISTATKSFDDF